jgi:hypothetical protein
MLMSAAVLNIGATEKQSIDAGTTSRADIKKRGMSYNWEIRGKKISGYCNVNGKGTISEFKQGICSPNVAPAASEGQTLAPLSARQPRYWFCGRLDGTPAKTPLRCMGKVQSRFSTRSGA